MVAEPVVVERLALEDVEPGPEEPARIEGFDQCELIDDRPPRRVDQDRPRLRISGQGGGVDQVMGAVVEVAVEAQEVD